MANKPEYVDLISDATRQKRRRREEAHVVAKTVFDDPEEAPQPERRLSNWPPGRIAQWRMENLSAWKMKVKGWKLKDWT
ncbi:MAG TPA: hypothetical protein VFB02_11075 [Bradyrhizobium sp.]|nr:hypothetical protein [Bradyrhizobium sp.]